MLANNTKLEEYNRNRRLIAIDGKYWVKISSLLVYLDSLHFAKSYMAVLHSTSNMAINRLNYCNDNKHNTIELMDGILYDSYQLRLEIISDLKNLFFIIQTKMLGLPCSKLIIPWLNKFLEFIDISYQLDEIIKYINRDGDVPETIRKSFFKDLKKTINSLKDFKFYSTLLLELFFHDHAQKEKACRNYRHLLFLDNWQQKMHDEKKNFSEHKNLSQIAKIKSLLSTTKSEYYLTVYTKISIDKLDQMLAKFLFNIIKFDQNMNPAAFFKHIREQKLKLKAQINSYESSLQNYGYTKGIVAFGINFFTSSFYHNISEVWYKNFNILSYNYERFFIHLLSPILVAMDIFRGRYTGMSNILLNSIAQPIINHIDTIINCGKKFGMRRESIIHNLLKLKFLIRLFIFLAVNIIFYGFGTGTFAFNIISYLSGTICSNLAGFLYNKISSSEISILKIILEELGFFGGQLAWRYCFDNISSFFAKAPTKDELFADIELCKKYRTSCKKYALDELGLKENATLKEVTKRFHELARKYHPDKISGNPEAFFSISNAKRLLKTLLTNTENSLDIPTISHTPNLLPT